MIAPPPYKNWNTLVSDVLAGDEPAVAVFGRNIGRMAFRFFHSPGVSSTAAADMAASCTTNVTTKLDTFDGRHFSAWIYKIFHNFRAEEMRNQPRLVEADDATPWETPMWEGHPGRLSHPALGAVTEALARLDECDQRIIALRCGREPLEFKQIAVEVGMKENTTRGRHKRALAKLGKLLRTDPRMKERIARCANHQPQSEV